MKEHGVQEYILWGEDDEGGGGYSLLIKGDPPSNHLFLKPRAIYSFQALSYHEARVKQYEFMGWGTPTYEDFNYPPEEYLA